MTALGSRIKELRKDRGLTQEALAHRAGLSIRAYRSLESGESLDPHYSTLCGIARGLDASLIELLADEPTGGPGQ